MPFVKTRRKIRRLQLAQIKLWVKTVTSVESVGQDDVETPTALTYSLPQTGCTQHCARLLFHKYARPCWCFLQLTFTCHTFYDRHLFACFHSLTVPFVLSCCLHSSHLSSSSYHVTLQGITTVLTSSSFPLTLSSLTSDLKPTSGFFCRPSSSQQCRILMKALRNSMLKVV